MSPYRVSPNRLIAAAAGFAAIALWSGTALAAPMVQDAQSTQADPNLGYLFAVFAVTWAAFFGYVFFMSRRQREVRREIEALRMALAEKESVAEGSEAAE